METLLIATALMTSHPFDGVVRDRFDMVEVNHVVTHLGNPIFDQVIFWDWSRLNKRFYVQSWHLMTHCRDTTDEADRQRFEQRIDKWCDGLSAEAQQQLRREMDYKGKFVGGPWMPHRDFRHSEWVVRVLDGTTDREIRCQHFRETTTQSDPERLDREVFPETLRRGFTPGR